MTSNLDLARQLLAIAQTGRHFALSDFDRERYDMVADIAARLLENETGRRAADLRATWQVEDGYATPKIEVRAAVFRDDAVLLVRERSDGRWTLPGGWADVNESPSEAIEKEIVQESGYRARAVKLAAVLDRRKHGHPEFLFHAWKLFFICEITGGEPATSIETDAVEFFPVAALPDLSTSRVTAEQIRRMLVHDRARALPADFD
jgi:ADP-ribose pyrophosphatase YjhB (NUDIX family)